VDVDTSLIAHNGLFDTTVCFCIEFIKSTNNKNAKAHARIVVHNEALDLMLQQPVRGVNSLVIFKGFEKLSS